MFKEFSAWNNGAADPNLSIGLDFQYIMSWYRRPQNRLDVVLRNGGNYAVHVTNDEFEAFKTDLKRAARLRAAYE